MEKGWVHVHVKEKTYVNDRQIIHESLVIKGSRLNRHNVTPNTSTKLLPSVT